MVYGKIRDKKIVSIIRGSSYEACPAIVNALYEGGIELCEVTFNAKDDQPTPDTLASISYIASTFSGKMLAGAGTVMNIRQVEAAAEAGAEFILSPDCNPAVIQRTKELGLVSIPGALTPTEVATAFQYGADMVKLFPAGNLGIDYIKAIRAPISHIPLMAVGGVELNNARQFLNAGCVALGIGSSLVSGARIAQKRFDEIAELARQFVEAVSEN